MPLLRRINPDKNEARYYRVDIGRRRSGFLITPQPTVVLPFRPLEHIILVGITVKV